MSFDYADPQAMPAIDQLKDQIRKLAERVTALEDARGGDGDE